MMDREINLVLFEEHSCVRKVILNRPKKFNSLNYDMISQLLKKLEVYENDTAVKLVILKGNGKAFSAGGDVVSGFNLVAAGHWSFGASYYMKLLTLIYVLGTYKKPLVSILRGIVIGAGAGMSMRGNIRVVTENTIFSMPEPLFGNFTDAGTSHFLSRLPGFFGEYIALTGARLDGTEMLECGLATHFILSKDLASMENAITDSKFINASDISSISEIIDKFIHKVHIKEGSPYTSLQIINQCFSKDTVEEILSSLENVAAKSAEKWMIEAIKFMKSASPTSLKISLRSIREGRMQKFEECIVRDYIIHCHIIRKTISDDIYEGIRAMHFEKDKKPQWQPPKLELVSEEMIDQYFSKIIDDECVSLKLPSRSEEGFTLQSKL